MEEHMEVQSHTKIELDHQDQGTNGPVTLTWDLSLS